MKRIKVRWESGDRYTRKVNKPKAIYYVHYTMSTHSPFKLETVIDDVGSRKWANSLASKTLIMRVKRDLKQGLRPNCRACRASWT